MSQADKAAHAKDMNDDEKLAMALIGSLPGLLGLIGGGIAAGPTGATAGLAGGLRGSAQGFGMVNDAKEQLRQEALGQADKAQGRVDRADDQLLGHEEKLGDQSFRTSERKGGEQFTNARDDKNNMFQGEQNSKNRAAERGNLIMRETAAMDRAMLEFDSRLLKAQQAAGAQHPTADESNAARYTTRMLHSKKELDALEQKGFKPSSMGTALEPWTPNFMVGDEMQQWVSAKRNWIAGNLRKDSGAAISKEEYAIDDKKYFPQPGDKPETVEEKRRLRAAEEQSMGNSAGRARSYIVMPEDIPQSRGAHPLDAKAVAWARANPGSPEADEILRENGIK
jgi:hypothetical protein